MFGKYTLRRQLFRLLWLLVFPLVYALTRLAARYPAFTERVYSLGIYPKLSQALGAISSAVPFSIAEFVIVIGAFAMLLLLIIRLIRAFSFKPERLVRLLSLVITYCIIGGMLLFAFYGLWGFNQFRVPLSQTMELPSGQYSTEQLETACTELAKKAAALRETASQDENGVFCYADMFDDTAKRVVNAYTDLAAEYPLFSRRVYPAKSVMHSKAMSYTGTAGIFICYTAEANVNTEQPDLFVAYDAAHETAHYLGWAQEDEANFVAFLACTASSDADIAYSGYMGALISCVNALYQYDSDAYARVCALYSDGMLRDLADYSEYYNKYDSSKIKSISTSFNDSYLKFNGQENGVETYSEVVNLILSYYDKCGLMG